jgi:hypothetical protein
LAFAVIACLVLVVRLARRKNLSSAALPYGLEYSSGASLRGLLDEMASLMGWKGEASILRGPRASAEYVLQGRIGDAEVCLFDYRYSVRYIVFFGVLRHCTVMYLRSPQLRLPPFYIQPHGVPDIVKDYVEVLPKECPGLPNHYLLQTKDPRGLGTFPALTLCQFLGKNPGLNLAGVGDWFVIYRHGKVIQPATMREFIDLGLSSLNAMHIA